MGMVCSAAKKKVGPEFRPRQNSLHRELKSINAGQIYLHVNDFFFFIMIKNFCVLCASSQMTFDCIMYKQKYSWFKKITA